MITEGHMREMVERHLAGTGHFLVDVEVRPGDKVVVEVDDPHAITLEQLVALNRALRADLDAQGHDLELQVGSPGMGRPVRVLRQYHKHVGRLVQVKRTDGHVLEGVLESVRGTTGIDLRVQHAAAVKGRLPKLDKDTTAIPFADIKSTQASVKFN